MPQLVFGTAALGMAYGLPRPGAHKNAMPSERDVGRLVEHALELGVTTFDTAPAYGEAETLLGRILGDRGRVWTKVPGEGLEDSISASFAKLRRPRIELLQWHNWSAALGADATWRARWSALRKDDRILQLGATTYGVADAVAAAACGMFDVVQCEFNVLNQRALNALAEYAARGEIAIALRSVFLQGALTDEGRELPARPALIDGVARARAIAGPEGLTRFALRAALERTAVSYVLIGIDRAGQLDEAVRIAGGPPLSDEQAAAIASLDLAGDPACDPRTW